MTFNVINNVRLIFTICLCLGVSGLHAEQHDAQPTTMQTVPGKSFSWSPSGKFFYDAPRFEDENIKELLELLMIAELEKKGFIYQKSDEGADFYLSYVAVLEEKLPASEVEKILASDPELNQPGVNRNRFEYGSLVVSALNASDAKRFWKNSWHDVTYLEMPKDLREERVKELVNFLMSTFPAAGK